MADFLENLERSTGGPEKKKKKKEKKKSHVHKILIVIFLYFHPPRTMTKSAILEVPLLNTPRDRQITYCSPCMTM